MSLATRITLLVTALLGACGLVAGVAFYRAAARSLDAELRGRIEARLAWLAAALDVELEDGELQLDATDDPSGGDAAAHWEIATTDGRVLWASDAQVPAERLSQSRTVSFGQADSRPVDPARIVAGDTARDESGGGRGRAGWAEVAVAELPAPVVESARRAVPGLEPQRAYRKTRGKKQPGTGEAAMEIRGTARGRAYALRLDAHGNVLRVKDGDLDPFAEYVLPPDAARVELVFTAHASAAEARDELSRMARTLWSVGPLALALTAAGLALLIRWQLRPLARMASQAARVGPGTAGKRIAAVGGAAELVGLRRAINQMIERLGEGLERERRFAADAAHELRSPLAEMRATVEVALRRPREAAEYREALGHIAGDLVRLQNLVSGLLQLVRGDTAAARGQPVPLQWLLRRATDACAPASAALGNADGLFVWGDPDLLHAAVCNVLQNATLHAPGAPPQVRVEPGDGGLRVVVADRGPGVPDADRGRIFQPLTRLDAARTPTGPEGFGLGLAVARATVRAFGGDLICQGRSDGGSGAEFVFTLRRAAAPADAAREDAAPHRAAARAAPSHPAAH